MARKDNKGRNLKTGEYQRPDGRYEYRYKDEITGKRNSVYAADLASLRSNIWLTTASMFVGKLIRYILLLYVLESAWNVVAG